MNEAILRHLGVALLGHWSLHPDDIPIEMVKTYREYKKNGNMFPNLLISPSLKPYLIEQELPVTHDLIGNATVIALALLFGQVGQTHPMKWLRPEFNEQLFNKLKTVVRIKRL